MSDGYDDEMEHVFDEVTKPRQDYDEHPEDEPVRAMIRTCG